MKNLSSLIALIISIIIIGIAFLFFSNSLIFNSVKQSKKKINTDKIISNAEIYENFYGIPHIIAENDDDLYFAIGYFQAKERLWQMEYFRRVAQGKLSEVFGESTVKYDKFFRSMGISEISKEIYDASNPITKRILTKYSEGINCFIENNSENLSFEFSALDFKPEKWQPFHSIMIGRMMAFELSIGFWIDIAMGEISSKIGYEKAIQLIPDYPNSSPHITDDTTFSNKNSKNNFLLTNNLEFDRFYGSSTYFRELRENLGLSGTSVGSNSFAVKTFDSIENKSSIIFANDPHLSLQLPPRWLQMHITSKNFNVSGMTIPGIPFIISGRNDNIAFGITNVMNDDIDFFVETLDESGNYYYRKDSTQKNKIEFMLDSIIVKNKETIKYYRKFTDISEIISDYHLLNYSDEVLKNKKFKSNPHYFKKNALTFRWTAKEKTDEIYALYQLNKADNILKFKEGLKFWGSPAMNFTYCDKSSNLGIMPAGLVPLREKNCNPNFPNNANQNSTGWFGFLNSDSLPANINPKRNFVASANNKTSRNFKNHISDYWEPSSRIERIYELIGEISNNFTIRDAQYIQNDYTSPYSKKIMEIALPVFQKYYYLLKNEEVQLLNSMKNWDYIMNSQSSEATVYNVFLERLIYNTFHDELGDRLYAEFVFVSSMPTRKILELMQQFDSPWFDKVNTEGIETKEYIIFSSFRESIDSLRKIFKNNNYKKWKWGDLHKLSLTHTFSDNPFLKPSVTYENLSTGGNNTTVNNTEWKYYQPYSTKVGASMRLICDLNDTVIYSIMPGGNSGDPMNSNYSNQIQIWLTGGYIKTPFSRNINETYQLTVQFIKD